MQMFQKKWLTQVMLLFIVLALVMSFTAVAYAGGGEEDPAPAAEEASAPMGKPPEGKPMGPPMGKPVKPIPELANCIGVTAFYDGNLNGIVDANEDAMDGASIVLMTEMPAPSEDPPIGPDGNPIVAEKPMGDMPPMGSPLAAEKPMGPPAGPQKPMGPPAGPQKPMGPPAGPQKPMGPPAGPQKPMGPPTGPQKPMGPPAGAEKPMPEKPTPQFRVLDRKITRDGGIAVFCDLKPGTYIVQGDAPEGITFGSNRSYVKLMEDDYQLLLFGFTYLNGVPEPTSGNGA